MLTTTYVTLTWETDLSWLETTIIETHEDYSMVKVQQVTAGVLTCVVKIRKTVNFFIQ
jgi:hypothetical protein